MARNPDRTANRSAGAAALVRRDVDLLPLNADHAGAMFRWMTDPAVRVNIGLKSEPSLRKTRQWIRRAREDASIKAFAVNRNDAYVGNVILDQLDGVLRTARFSVYIGDSKSRGRGVGAAAAYKCLRYAFKSLKLHKIWLTVHAENARAIALYRRLGFMHEGTLRDEFLLGSRRIDAVRMGLLASELRLPEPKLKRKGTRTKTAARGSSACINRSSLA